MTLTDLLTQFRIDHHVIHQSPEDRALDDIIDVALTFTTRDEPLDPFDVPLFKDALRNQVVATRAQTDYLRAGQFLERKNGAIVPNPAITMAALAEQRRQRALNQLEKRHSGKKKKSTFNVVDMIQAAIAEAERAPENDDEPLEPAPALNEESRFANGEPDSQPNPHPHPVRPDIFPRSHPCPVEPAPLPGPLPRVRSHAKRGLPPARAKITPPIPQVSPRALVAVPGLPLRPLSPLSP